MKEKLVFRVLQFLSDGQPKLRYQVTSLLRNHPKTVRDEAINHLTSGRFVTLIDGSTMGWDKKGRTPYFIKITPKGQDELRGMSQAHKEKSVWFTE